MAVLTTLVKPSILNQYAADKRSSKTVIEALKSGFFPESHYRRYIQKIDDLKFNKSCSIRLPSD